MAYNVLSQSRNVTINFRRLSMNDVMMVQDFVAAYFSPKEKLTGALRVPLSQVIKIDRYRVPKLLEHDASLGAFDTEKNKLVAVILNSKQVKYETHQTADVIYPWQSIIARLVDELTRNQFQDLGVNTVLTTSMLAVDSAYAMQGLGTNLYIASQNLALKCGYDVLTALTSSNHSFKIGKKLNYTVLRSIHLPEYLDKASGGKPFVNASPPHNRFSFCYKRMF